MVCRAVCISLGVQIKAATKEREEAVEASARFMVMREDVVVYKETLQGRRREACQVSMGGRGKLAR